MTGLVVLDIIIGLVFIYLIYSLLATILQEIVATLLSFRAKILEKGIHRMLENEQNGHLWLKSRLNSWIHLLTGKRLFGNTEQKLSTEFYNHPLIKYLGEDKVFSKPAYLSAKNFSKVMIDFLRGEDVQLGQNFSININSALNDGKIRFSEDKEVVIPEETLKYLRSLWVDAQGDVEKFRFFLEQWFDITMERTTSWYKQYTQSVLLVIGLGIAIAFNVDTIQITSKLATDPVLREQIVKQADAFVKEHPNLKEDLARLQKNHNAILKDTAKATKDSVKVKANKDSTDKVKDQMAHLDSLSYLADSLVKGDIAKVNKLMGLGWECKKICNCSNKCHYRPSGDAHWFMRFIGWLITALAISLGAPFWFDLLNKLMKLRGAIKTEGQGNTPPSGTASNTIPVDKRHG